MSDYLTRLVERSFGVGQIVRPRVGSLFDASLSAVLAETVEQRPSEPAPDAEEARSKRQETRVETPASADARRESAPIDTRQVDPLAAPLPSVVVERNGQENQMPDPSAMSDPDTVRGRERSEPASSAAADPVLPHALFEEQHRRRGDDDSGAEDVRTETPRLRPAFHDGVHPEPPHVGPIDTPLRPLTDVDRKVEPTSIDPIEPPVVRVTIGRIDVRAVLPTQPTQTPPSKRRPKMTLEEFLGRDAKR
jgi:hypothetical protein